MNLLIVDDHPINLKLLRAQLEAEGHCVVEAVDGVAALEALASARFDGVVSDILMPRMDGYRLCIEVRKNPDLCTVPFVLYTSTYNSPADRELAQAAGADAYIAKPAPTETILAAIAAAAAGSRNPVAVSEENDVPILKQYNQTLVRKLEDKSAELERAYDGLSQTEARLSGLVETAMDAIIACDQQQRVTLFNAAAESMFGYTRAEAIGGPLNRFIPERFQSGHASQVETFGETGKTKRMGARLVWAKRSDGSEFPIEASISKLETSRGRLYTVFIRDITERHQSERKIHGLNRVLKMLSGINTLIVRCTNRDELFREACRIAIDDGHFLQAWIGTLSDDRAAIRFAARHGVNDLFEKGLHAYLKDHRLDDGGLLAKAVGELQPVVLNDLATHPLAIREAVEAGSRSVVILPLRMDGAAAGVLVLHADSAGFFDDEEMKLLNELAGDISFALEDLYKSEQIHYLAHYDALTGLPNRRLFADRLGQAMRVALGEEGLLAVVFFDVERFRNVNEKFGRSVGDELLKRIAARLQSVNPSAARIGVDVFAIKLRDRQSVAEVARAFEDVFARCFGEPYELAGEELRIGARGGIAVFPDDGADAEALLRNAEAALRRARSMSEHCVFYASNLNARAAEALSIESKLRRAIERREFVLHYQPKVAFSDRRICGVEALIRWQDPERGLVPPVMFIPVLEECGLIGPVGEWALRQALIDQGRWRAAGFAPPCVAVNVSPLQLRKDEFAEVVGDILASNDNGVLELEITESVMMENVDRNIEVLRKIRAMGVSIAIDDFGTGYSSLSYIAKLPVTSLKIDRAFVTGMPLGPEGMSIVASIVALAHSLNLKVVAEGVETEEQARLLRLLRCEEAQGYLFSKPVPYEAIEDLLRHDAALPVSAG